MELEYGEKKTYLKFGKKFYISYTTVGEITTIKTTENVEDAYEFRSLPALNRTVKTIGGEVIKVIEITH